MMSLKKLQGDSGREQTSTRTNAYRNIPMFCDEGLHEVCFTHMSHLPKDTRILVLGSGSGAFDQRLVDEGFSCVTSVDFRPDFFRAIGTTFIERDLNENFDDLGTFDLIIAIELIEHLENPAHFLRNVSKCLAPDGTILVTTPNIESGPSRAGFLIMGRVAFFTETDMKGSGHISPLLRHVFAFHAENAGLSIQKHAYNRNAWGARFRSNVHELVNDMKRVSLKHLLHAGVIILKSVSLFMLWPFSSFNAHNGNIHIYVLRKK